MGIALTPDAWLVRYGTGGKLAALFLDHAAADGAAARLHGTVHALVLMERAQEAEQRPVGALAVGMSDGGRAPAGDDTDCPACGGSGVESGWRCLVCDGSGVAP